MKKIWLVAVALIAAMMLAACGGGESNTENGESGTNTVTGEGFRVGFAREKCMPDAPVPMQGYGNVKSRFSEGFLDYLENTCIAITDAENNTLLMLTTDNCGSGWTEDFRQAASKKFGIPYENITVTATHTHSSVATGSTDVESVVDYNAKLHGVCLQVCEQALADQKPAEMYWGTVDLTGYNFIRHYLMEDGTIAGDNFGDSNQAYMGYATQENPTMNIIQFKRAEGEKDIYLANWRVHPHITGGSDKKNLSADFPTITRKEIEKQLDCHFGYYNGDAGNSNPFTRIEADGVAGVTNLVQERNYKEYGKQVADLIVAGINAGMEKIGDGTGLIKVTKIPVTIDVNHSEDHLASTARLIAEKWTESDSKTAAMELAGDSGINSVYHANGILTKVSLPATVSETVYVAQIGEVGMTFAPNEMFVENGNYVRENSPYKYTMVIGYTNGHEGYMPSQQAYDYHCYEMNTSRFAPGTGEMIANLFVDELNKLIKK